MGIYHAQSINLRTLRHDNSVTVSRLMKFVLVGAVVFSGQGFVAGTAGGQARAALTPDLTVAVSSVTELTPDPRCDNAPVWMLRMRLLVLRLIEQFGLPFPLPTLPVASLMRLIEDEYSANGAPDGLTTSQTAAMQEAIEDLLDWTTCQPDGVDPIEVAKFRATLSALYADLGMSS